VAISFLEPIYPFVWLDAIHYKIKDSGKYVSKAVYTILGVNINTRSSLRYIASKDSVQKEFAKDLKLIYQAYTKELAEEELLKLDEKWGKKYPLVINSWQSKWDNLSVYFKYPADIRKVIYTTNII